MCAHRCRIHIDETIAATRCSSHGAGNFAPMLTGTPSAETGPDEHADGTDGTGASVAPGMYFYELRVNGASQTRKAVLLR